MYRINNSIYRSALGLRLPKGNLSLTGFTLLELVIATLLLTLVLSAATGIYLSGWKLFRESQFTAEAQRNATAPMLHIVKRLQTATSFTLQSSTELRFTVNPWGTTPGDIRRYIFQNDNNQILYDTDTINGNEIVIGTHISTVTFSVATNGVATNGIVATISITSEDNRGQDFNLYTTTTNVTARYGASPPV